jgi:hypothetical protein
LWRWLPGKPAPSRCSMWATSLRVISWVGISHCYKLRSRPLLTRALWLPPPKWSAPKL